MSLAGFQAQNHPQQTGKRGAVDAVDDRGTDRVFFDALSKRFGGFDLDVAAAPHNAKCERFYTIAEDGLEQPWDAASVWCNPPYSDLGAWVRKAWRAWVGTDHATSCPLDGSDDGCTCWRGVTPQIVMLVPANRTEQGWWQDLVEPNRDRGGGFSVEFLRGRMRFDRPGAVIGPKGDRPPFGCCLLIWGP